MMSEEVTPLAQLFARDPNELSDQDINAIIEGVRKMRHTFQDGKGPASTKAMRKPKKLIENLDIKLDL